MALALAKDNSTQTANSIAETVEGIDRALAAAKAKLAEATAARERCRARRNKFAQEDDKPSYMKEKHAEDELDFEVESAQAKISKLEAVRPAVAEREAADGLRCERSALLDKSRKFQKGELKKVEEAFAFLCDVLRREAELYAEVTDFNLRAERAGIDLLESPEAAIRHMPGVPARQDGTRNVKRSRLRKGMERSSTTTGADRYETYTAAEPVIVPEIPAFKPAPLFLRVVLPGIRRDDPGYVPPGVQLPWYGR
jgi:hypothetical protein